MPTVPTSFVPQVAPSGGGESAQFVAPGIATAENLGAQQQVQLGRAMTQAGDVAFRIGSSIQDALDEAAAKEADVATLTQFNQMSAQYLSTAGKDAETQYQATLDQMSQVGASALDGLQTETQRKMFAPVLARNMASFQSRMLGHRNSAIKEYNVKEGFARGEQYADAAVVAYANKDAINPYTGQPYGRAEFDVNVGVALNSVRAAAAEMGIPADSAQARDMERKVYDKVATGVMGDLLRQNKYTEAQAFLDEMAGSEAIDPKVNDQLRSTLDANRERVTIEELTQSIRVNGVLRSKSDPESYNEVITEESAAPESLRDALNVAEQIPDMETRRAVQRNLRTQYEQEERLTDEEYRVTVENIEQYLAVPGNGIAGVDPMAWGALKPLDRERLQQGQSRRDDAAILDSIYTDPKKLTPEFLSKNWRKLTPETYRKLSDTLAKPAAILDATVDAQAINRALIDNKLPNLANPDKASVPDREASIILRDNIQQMVAIEQERLGRKLSDQEKRPIIDQAILETARLKKKFLGMDWIAPDTEMPMAAMKPEQFAQAYVSIGGKEVPAWKVRAAPEQARKALAKEGIGNPTQAEIAQYIEEKGLLK